MNDHCFNLVSVLKGPESILGIPGVQQDGFVISTLAHTSSSFRVSSFKFTLSMFVGGNQRNQKKPTGSKRSLPVYEVLLYSLFYYTNKTQKQKYISFQIQ